MQRVWLVPLTIFVSVCGDGPTTPAPVRPPGPPASIRLTPSSLVVFAGESRAVRAQALDAYGRPTAATFEWVSSAPDTVSVTREGHVIAMTPGQAFLTVSTGAVINRLMVAVGPKPEGEALAFSRLGVIEVPPFVFEYTSDLVVYFRSHTWQVHGSDSMALTAPAWSPQDSHLAITVLYGTLPASVGHVGQPLHGFEESSDIYVLAMGEGIPSRWRRITRDGWSRFADWSPDGRRILYVSGRPGQDNLFTVDTAGGEPTRLSMAPGHHTGPRWSPDGRRIAFSRENSDFTSDIWVMNADGTGLVQLTDGKGINSAPGWSPDGAHIAFSSNRATAHYNDIFTVAAGGGTPQRVTVKAPGTSDEQPAWSLDGQWIAFSRMAESDMGNPGIYIVRSDGSGLQRVSTSVDGFADYFPAWRPLTSTAPGSAIAGRALQR